MAEAIEFAWPADAVEVGCIAGAWGVKGWVKVSTYSRDPLALFAAKRWFVVPPPGPEGLRRFPDGSSLTVVQSKTHGAGIVAQVQGVHERDAAEALRGARLFVPRQGFPPPARDEYYWVDLIGLTVVRVQGENLGTVVGLIDTGPHSVLRVAPDTVPEGKTVQEAERLIPFTAAYVDSVCLEERRITVNWGWDF